MDKVTVGSYKFVTAPSEVDFTGHLTLCSIGDKLLQCAGIHAGERGFGIDSLNENQFTWVLSRVAIELYDKPKSNESFTINTWVENIYKLFTNRNFEIVNKKGISIGYARSIWAMIDLKTRKSADLISLYGNSIESYVSDKDCPIEKPGRIKIVNAQLADTVTIKYSDIDLNGHVNSIKYIEHILDLFPCDLYREKRIKRFEIIYLSECFYGDVLSFYVQSVNEDEYCVDVRTKENESVCHSKLYFQKLE